jgi:hypothetical protein
MPVIINDFEIVLDPPPQTQPPAQGESPQQPSAAVLRPEDVERIVRHFERRRGRVHAD